MNIETLLAIVILSAALVNSVILVIKRNYSPVDNRMLGLTLFFYNVYLLVYFLWVEVGYLLEFPHLLRTVSPWMYLTGPLFYFYIRNSINATKGFKKWDWIHFLPAIIHFIDLIPFYLESEEVKLALAKIIVDNPDQLRWLGGGIIPISYHYFLRTILLLGYYLYSVTIVIASKNRSIININKKILNNWLYISLGLMGMVVFSNTGFDLYYTLDGVVLVKLPDLQEIFFLVTLLGVLFLNLYINFHPEFVFEFNHENTEHSDLQIATSSLGGKRMVGSIHESLNLENDLIEESEIDHYNMISEEDLLTIKDKILDLLENDKVYKNPVMNLTDFSRLVGISSKIVSHSIKQIFGKGYNELINSYRINYAIQKIEEGFLDDYTLDGLSESVGFNSRTTFFNSFKKIKACSPGEYWKNFQNMN